MSIYCV